MAFLVLGYTTQPLLSEVIQEGYVQVEAQETSCCDPDSPECCCCSGNDTRDSSNDRSSSTDPSCTGHCDCAPGSVVVIAPACYSAEITLFGDFLGTLQSVSESYQYNPFSTIWHPPNA